VLKEVSGISKAQWMNLQQTFSKEKSPPGENPELECLDENSD